MIKTQIKSNGNCKVRHWLLGAETANGTLVVGYHCSGRLEKMVKYLQTEEDLGRLAGEQGGGS